MFQNITSLISSLHDVITIIICFFAIKKKKRKINDVRKINICCLRYAGKSKIFINIKAKIGL